MDIKNLYKKATQQLGDQLPFVLYRKPGEKTVQLILQNDAVLHTIIHFEVSGFVFSPFDHHKPSVLIPTENSTYYSAEIHKNYIPERSAENMLDTIEDAVREDHKKLIELGIDTIHSGSLQKVVISRREEIKNMDKNPVYLFEKMLATYQTAFVYLWYHPKIGIWMGATPETLLQIKKNYIFTMALAGTQSYQGQMEVEWGTKELEEQRLVTDFILKALEGKVVNKIISPVETYRAATLLHLKTDIRAGFIGSDSGITELIKALHPTPAVCGLPRDAAKDFILNHEKYDRSFYTGFLGELDMDTSKNETSHLFVNLRCMEIKKATAFTYIGGGITKDSDPEKEWQETVRKTYTMKNVLLD